MQTIREGRKGSKARPDEDKTDLQSKTRNKLDNGQGSQGHKTKHRKQRIKPRMPAGPDHDWLRDVWEKVRFWKYRNKKFNPPLP